MPYTIWAGRRFGVEMEMLNRSRASTRARIDGTALNAAISQALAPVNPARTVSGDGHHYHSNAYDSANAWEVKYDGSITGSGFEVTTPALELDEDGHCAELRAGCDAVKSLRPIVDRSCGLHVHVDCSDYDWRDLQKLLAMWLRYEPFFFEMLPESRRANNYCEPLRAGSWRDAANGGTYRYEQVERAILSNSQEEFRAGVRYLGRYLSLNFSGWWLHGRVEFRLHSGTVSYDKIRRWVTILTTMCSRIKRDDAPRLSRAIKQPKPEVGFRTRYVLRMIGLTGGRWQEDNPVGDDVAEWVERRRARFARSS